MSSRSALARRESPPEKAQAIPVDDAKPSLPTDAPANDERQKPFSFYGDPLIGMAVASIILLMTFAALLS